jgi:predicted aldo/keto reductase-like oxidoreductase
MSPADPGDDHLHRTLLEPETAHPRRVCRLGLATRGSGNLQIDDIHYALEHGVNFLNWCGQPDALSAVVASLGRRRHEVVVCVQFEARTASEARNELDQILRELGTNYVDVLTFYDVEEPGEWHQITAQGGALLHCQAARRAGQIRFLGLTTHQRRLGAEAARSGLLDLLMVRYNAAHRGAETDVFPITDSLRIPVVVYTCLRWGALLRAAPDDPPGFIIPRAPDWYRFTLQSPSVFVALMAPESREELVEDLAVLNHVGPLAAEDYARLLEYGQRARGDSHDLGLESLYQSKNVMTRGSRN